MRIKYIKRVFLLILITCLLLSQTVFAETSGTSQTFDQDYIESVTDMVKGLYNGDITDDRLLQGAMKGIFNTMDPYTVFFTPEEAKSFLESMNGSFEGIGIMMSKEGEYITVNKVFPGSPAEKAGIAEGDRIVQADGKSVIGVSTEEAKSLISGEAGTKVILGIIKNGSSNIINVEVERARIEYNPVTFDIKDGIGYIKLEIFNSNAYAGIKSALDKFDSAGVKKVILDLRDNPGGELDMAVAIAREFVPRGLITRLEFKSGKFGNEDYYSYLDTQKYKLAVLVNENSASASEILAGAIQDSGAGTLIGTKTFGKAKVQSLIPILTPEAYEKYEKQLGVKTVNVYDLYNLGVLPPDNEIAGWAKITTGMYKTPKGRMIDGVGITPDITVENPGPVNGIDIKSIQKLPVVRKPKLNDSGTDVYNAEKILKALGYYNDAPDFKFNDKAFKAVCKLQKDMGGYPYGVLDFSTQKYLNEKLDELVQKTDKQYAKAVELLRGMN